MQKDRINTKALIEYVEEFREKLADTMDEALEINNPMLAGLSVSRMYGPIYTTNAAFVGYELDIPVESSIALMVMIEALRFEKKHRGFSLSNFFSVEEKRKLYHDHTKMAEYTGSWIEPYVTEDTLQNFILKFTELTNL